MRCKRLFIIGNGFDIYHGIKSRYADFRKYLESVDPDVCHKLKEYFDYDNLWSDFELSLAAFEANRLVENAEDYLVSYGAEEWSDAYHHDYQNEISEVVHTLSYGLKTRFASWIAQIKIPVSARKRLLNYVDDKAFFLTFNYTPTLQAVYGIDDENIFHIHGKVGNKVSEVVLGHAWNPIDRLALRGNIGLEVLEAEDPRVTEGNQIIEKYFALTYKPTAEIIRNHRSFFKGLSSVEEIYILGHSMLKADIEYFQHIVNSIDLEVVRWHASYFGADELDRHKETIKKLGVRQNMVKFSYLESLAGNLT